LTHGSEARRADRRASGTRCSAGIDASPGREGDRVVRHLDPGSAALVCVDGATDRVLDPRVRSGRRGVPAEMGHLRPAIEKRSAPCGADLDGTDDDGRLRSEDRRVTEEVAERHDVEGAVAAVPGHRDGRWRGRGSTPLSREWRVSPLRSLAASGAPAGPRAHRTSAHGGRSAQADEGPEHRRIAASGGPGQAGHRRSHLHRDLEDRGFDLRRGTYSCGPLGLSPEHSAVRVRAHGVHGRRCGWVGYRWYVPGDSFQPMRRRIETRAKERMPPLLHSCPASAA
jgi:hypothetical protein